MTGQTPDCTDEGLTPAEYHTNSAGVRAGHRIPAPPDRPRYHEYAAGAIGDHRQIGVRLAERIVGEDLPHLPTTQRDYVVAALARAFRAGWIYRDEVGGETP